MIRFLALAAVSLATLSAAPATAKGPVAFDNSWKTQKFSLFSSNTYGFRGNAITVASDGSVSLAWRRLAPSFWSARKAGWSWRVDEGVPPTDLSRKGGDDRNLALYFVFVPEAEARRLEGARLRKLLGNDAARVLVYVWGGAHARGAMLESPYLGSRGKTIVLRGSGNGRAREAVDLARDHERAFGTAPGALVGLAVSGDSDDTDSRIRAAIGNLTLE